MAFASSDADDHLQVLADELSATRRPSGPLASTTIPPRGARLEVATERPLLPGGRRAKKSRREEAASSSVNSTQNDSQSRRIDSTDTRASARTRQVASATRPVHLPTQSAASSARPTEVANVCRNGSRSSPCPERDPSVAALASPSYPGEHLLAPPRSGPRQALGAAREPSPLSGPAGAAVTLPSVA